MRRILYIGLLGALLLLFPACVKMLEKETLEEPISFTSSARSGFDVVTKTGGNEEPEQDDHLRDLPPVEHLLAENSQMLVYGDWRAQTSSSQGEKIFSHVQVTFNATSVAPAIANANGSGWKYMYTKYWRRSGDYHFVAVHPYIADRNKCTYNENSSMLETSYYTRSDDFDLMVAQAARTNMAIDYNTKKGPVDLHFRHACAAIRFLFRKSAAIENTEYKLHSFSVQNLRTVGSLRCDFSNYDAVNNVTQAITLNSWELNMDLMDDNVFSWRATTDSPNKTIPMTYADWRRDQSTDIARWHYVIPQNSATAYSGSRPVVSFSVLVGNSTTPVYSSIQLPAFVWEPGKVYNYYIQIQPGKINITVVTSEWDPYYVAADDLVF